MASQLLDLKRLWRDTHNLEAYPLGWLYLEDDEIPERFGLHSAEYLTKHDCLFLKGRPGAGKTAEVARLANGPFPALPKSGWWCSRAKRLVKTSTLK